MVYEPEHLTGTGISAGRPVKCIPPDHTVAIHSGYQLDENDYRDVKALCDRFGLSLPEAYLLLPGTGGVFGSRLEGG